MYLHSSHIRARTHMCTRTGGGMCVCEREKEREREGGVEGGGRRRGEGESVREKTQYPYCLESIKSSI